MTWLRKLLHVILQVGYLGLILYDGHCTHYIMSLLHVAAAAATAQAPAQAPAPQEKDTGE